MAELVNAREFLERISTTPETAKIVKALLDGIPGNMSFYERQQCFVDGMLQELADYRDRFEFGLAVTQLAATINSWR